MKVVVAVVGSLPQGIVARVVDPDATADICQAIFEIKLLSETNAKYFVNVVAWRCWLL